MDPSAHGIRQVLRIGKRAAKRPPGRGRMTGVRTTLCYGRTRKGASMATAAKTVFPHITADPDVCHGRPCIAGTRVRVMDIVAAHEQGVTPADLQDYFATRPLTLA